MKFHTSYAFKKMPLHKAICKMKKEKTWLKPQTENVFQMGWDSLEKWEGAMLNEKL